MTLAAPIGAVDRLPEDDDELWWLIYYMLGVKVPRQRVCPDHVAPFEALADAYFARSTVSVWKASRGFGGKSWTLALLATIEAMLLGAESSVLGGSAAQSLNVHSHSQSFWHAPNAPKELLAKDPTKYDTWLTNDSHIRTLTASQTSVRGPHPQRLRMDEIDEMEVDILDAALGQPMRKHNQKTGQHIETQVVMSSTHQYPDRTMSAMLALAAEKSWPIYEWCYKETSNPIDGWLSAEEVARQKTIIPKAMWEAEYDLQEPNFEGRAMAANLVELSFSPMNGGEWTGDDPVFIEDRDPGAKYVTGIDWAKQRDMTVVATFKFTDLDNLKYECVAWQKCNRLPWQVMVDRAMTQWEKYGGVLVHDATGIGNVVDDLIRERLTISQQKKVKAVVMTGGQSRMALFSEYVAAIESQDIIYPRIEYAFREHLYVTDEDLYKSSGHPPDSIVAGALAWKYRPKTRVRPTAPLSHIKASHFNL